ncbi:unannotated protein [freshwater metagenome]|uniref:Unannotated protein n=1 Tax=freshwater metagenome TaxID=449393 RepID=A0A6J6SZV5_9ZZZZ
MTHTSGGPGADGGSVEFTATIAEVLCDEGPSSLAELARSGGGLRFRHALLGNLSTVRTLQ